MRVPKRFRAIVPNKDVVDVMLDGRLVPMDKAECMEQKRLILEPQQEDRKLFVVEGGYDD